MSALVEILDYASSGIQQSDGPTLLVAAGLCIGVSYSLIGRVWEAHTTNRLRAVLEIYAERQLNETAKSTSNTTVGTVGL
jgi:hypothetical protein